VEGDMPKLIAFVILGVLVLAGCGESGPPTFTRAEKWDVIAEGAVIERRGSELLTLIPSSSVTGYQAEFAAGGGSEKTILRYDVTLQGGPGYIGLLSGDKTRWLDNVTLPANETSKGEVSVQTGKEQVYVVLQTSAETTPGTVFVVSDVSLAYQ
jgi:hypothetical protein